MFTSASRCFTPGILAENESCHAILAAGALAVAAQVVLAGCLPGHPEPGGDLRPPDAQADRLVHQHREFGFCLPPGESGAFDPRHYLGWRQLGSPRRRAWRIHACPVRSPGLYVLDYQLALGPAHVIQHPGRV